MRLIILLLSLSFVGKVSAQTIFSGFSNPSLGVHYDTAASSGCASCQIMNPSLAVDSTKSNHATINVQGGSSDYASLKMMLPDSVSAGSNAGVVFTRGGGVNAAVLNSITLKTYNNDTLKEAKSGSGLSSYLTSGGLRIVEFTTTYTFDAVEIELERLGGGVNTVEVYFAYGNNAQPLPIELVSFVGFQEGDYVRIKWATASEYNNKDFVMQKSENGIDFKSFDNTTPYGNSNTIKHYSTVDFAPQVGTNYYRLAQIDNDGTISYSKIIKVEYSENGDMDEDNASVYPNPVSDVMNINFKEPVNGGQIVVADMMGNRLVTQQIYSNTRDVSINTGNMSTGTYLVYIYSAKGELCSKELITKY